MKNVGQINWLHSLFNLTQLISWHLALLLYIQVGKHHLTTPLFYFSFILTSVIHQRVLSEWIHEASHFNFFKNRNLNDKLINLFAGIIFLKSIKAHRDIHFFHHHQETYFQENDPETSFYLVTSKRDLILSFLKDLMGLTAFKIWKTYQTSSGQNSLLFKLSLLIAHGSLCFFCYQNNFLGLYFLYYFTLITIYILINRIRIYGQHTSIKNSDSFHLSRVSRTICCGIFERLFITSPIMAYHHEHHQKPGLPFRELAKIHQKNENKDKLLNSNFLILKHIFKKLA